MANLKTLKLRIKSVKSTQKITKAMKMVAASKLRKAREKMEASYPYSESLNKIVTSLADSVKKQGVSSIYLDGGAGTTDLLLVVSSDRGLCGGFNTNIVKAVKRFIDQQSIKKRSTKLLFIGKKAYEVLKGNFKDKIQEKIELKNKRSVEFDEVNKIAASVISYFDKGEFAECHIVFNHFKSVISQEIICKKILPIDLCTKEDEDEKNSLYEFEPSEEVILNDLLPKNFTMAIYTALLDSATSEQGARMSAMDNATRNAGEMIKGLTLEYNRTRQSSITKELIEIISGAEAL